MRHMLYAYNLYVIDMTTSYGCDMRRMLAHAHEQYTMHVKVEHFRNSRLDKSAKYYQRRLRYEAFLRMRQEISNETSKPDHGIFYAVVRTVLYPQHQRPLQTDLTSHCED
jgi:hypothetical protein